MLAAHIDSTEYGVGPLARLITCGGDYDRQKQHDEQNVVVLALPAG